MKDERKHIGDRDLEMVISKIMRWGVLAAITFTATGGIIFLFRHSGQTFNHRHYTAVDQSVVTIFRDAITGIFNGNGRSFIMLGIMLLFATPVIRVIFSLIGFILEKDRLYIVITSIVLAIILISISGGFAA